MLRQRLKDFKAAPARRMRDGLRSNLFIVLSPGGVDTSEFLAQLRAHPDLLCHADMQGPLSERGFADLAKTALTAARKSREIAAFKESFSQAFLYKYVLDSRGRLAVGFAVDYDSLLNSINAPLRDVLQHDLDVKILLYAPKNSLHAYVEGLRGKLASSEAAMQPVAVDPQKFLLHARQVERMNAYVERLFEGHQQMKVESESLRQPHRGASLRRIAGFLGLEGVPTMGLPDGGGVPDLCAMVSNFSAIETALRDTPYAWMLGS